MATMTVHVRVDVYNSGSTVHVTVDVHSKIMYTKILCIQSGEVLLVDQTVGSDWIKMFDQI